MAIASMVFIISSVFGLMCVSFGVGVAACASKTILSELITLKTASYCVLRIHAILTGSPIRFPSSSSSGLTADMVFFYFLFAYEKKII